MRAGAVGQIIRWFAGGLIGTGVIAITSPWFVRSYVPLRVDPVRKTWTLPPGADYRWRSEGYATTWIGPMGMPGRRSLASRPAAVPVSSREAAPVSSHRAAPAAPRPAVRVALWGDSQAEGVCVSDSDKLFAQAEQLARGDSPLTVFPLARSGEDAAVWLSQMPAVERTLMIDVHVMLIVDLPDLFTAADAPLPPIPEPDGARAALASRLPAFVIQAARHVLTEADGSTPRTLRFSLGPVADEPSPPQPTAEPEPDWPVLIDTIAAVTDRPVIILYAPRVPEIVGGIVRTESRWAASVAAMRRAARRHDIVVASARAALSQSAAEGNWPHGFHNGRIGSGHLNATGYRIVADRLVRAVGQVVDDGVAERVDSASD